MAVCFVGVTGTMWEKMQLSNGWQCMSRWQNLSLGLVGRAHVLVCLGRSKAALAESWFSVKKGQVKGGICHSGHSTRGQLHSILKCLGSWAQARLWPQNGNPGRRQVGPQLFEPLPPVWEMQICVSVPRHLGKWISKWEVSCLSLYLLNSNK